MPQPIPCPGCGTQVAPGTRFCGTCGHAISPTESAGPPSLATPADELAGREIAGRYRIVRQLGAGGMGAVYIAEQISLKRTVALKLLKTELSSDPGLVRRFNTEAELAAKLNHPNTVTLFDFGQDGDGTLFIVMEYVAGRSLREVIQREAPLPLSRTLHIVEQIAASLADAHARGIVHRDMKPDNVMLSEIGKRTDVVRVLDFGIAKLRDERADGEVPVTRAGDMLGTPQYMAPEQIRSEQVDARTDVYALGAVLYEMITGRLPFEAPTVMAILGKHLTETAPAPSQRRPDLAIPPALDQLVMDALHKDPAGRPPSMDAFTERLAALRVQVGGAGAAPIPRRTTRPPGVPLTVDAVPHAATAAPVASHAGPAPGYAVPHPTPAPPQPYPAYAPPPMPAGVPPTHRGSGPYGAPPPAKSSHLGLWLGLGIAGAVGAALLIAFVTTSDKEKTELEKARDQLEEIKKGLEDFEVPDFSYPQGKDVGSPAGERWKHPFLGYGLIVPAGFQPQANNAPSLSFFNGMTDGVATIIAISGEAVPGKVGDDVLDMTAQALALQSGANILDKSWRTYQGALRLAVLYDIAAQGLRYELVLYAHDNLVVGVAFGTPIAQFDRTAAARQALFERRVVLP